MMAKGPISEHLVWTTTEVAGRRVEYGVAGHGLPVVFIHGWALGSHAYKRALKRLVRLGCRVYAPALPGFGGSTGLHSRHVDLAGYAAWAVAFMDAVGIDEPAVVIGHSFGGGVATKLAHDFPDRVEHLVLVDSVGAGVWSAGGQRRTLAERPLWDWAVHFPMDVALAWGAVPTVAAILEDAVTNVVANPLGLWRAGMLARQADLTAELAALKGNGVPVTVIWGDRDSIVPRASFDAMCETLGVTGHLVEGRHSWLLADPDAFAAAMTQPVTAAHQARAARAALARRQPQWQHASNA